MPASVPTGAGELLPPAPGPFCPTRRPQQPTWALSTSRPPRALQPPLGLSSVADSSLPQAFARAIPAAWDTVPCPCTPPHTPVPPSAPQGSFSNVLIRCLRSSPFRHSGLGARAGVRVCLRSSRGLPPPRPDQAVSSSWAGTSPTCSLLLGPAPSAQHRPVGLGHMLHVLVCWEHPYQPPRLPGATFRSSCL